LEWSEESIEGSWQFLNRVYRLIDRHAGKLRAVGAWDFKPKSEKERELAQTVFDTVRRVTQDFDTRWHFNSAIALIMEMTNEIYAREPLEEGVSPEARKEILQMLTLMLAPMTPHICEEMWEMLGHSNGLWSARWPISEIESVVGGEIDEAAEAENRARLELARKDEVEIPVQVNGRVRGRLRIAVGAAEADVVKQALALPAIALHVNGKRVVKQVYVPNKMLNLVVA
jgi:leucyl-tRNA synthetase